MVTICIYGIHIQYTISYLYNILYNVIFINGIISYLEYTLNRLFAKICNISKFQTFTQMDQNGSTVLKDIADTDARGLADHRVLRSQKATK